MAFLILLVLCSLLRGDAKDVQYDFVISRTFAAPDGFSRELILVNGQYPGPTIYAHFGDTLHVKVTNNLNVSTTIHWHGIFQTNTPWYDGAVGFTQCAIPSGKELTYVFHLQQTGTYWWHAHYDSQIVDGLRGALVIYGNPTLYEGDLYDEEYILQLSDFYHTDALTLVGQYLNPNNSAGNEPIPDSGVINGAGDYNCSYAPAGSDCTENRTIQQRYATFTVEAPKRYRFRVINVAAFAMFKVSIDNHKLTIIEVDGVDVQPYSVDQLSLNVAQRYSFIVEAKAAFAKRNYWIRADIQTTCFPVPAPDFNNHIWGILHYSNVPLSLPTTNGKDIDDCVELNQLSLVPTIPQNWFQTPAVSVNWTIDFQTDDAGINYAYLGNISYKMPPSGVFSLNTVFSGGNLPDTVNPLILEVEANATIEFILTNFDGGEHPIHLHGHNFGVLGVGSGIYNPKKNKLKIVNPPRRDVIGVPANGWAVIRFLANNPGVWAFHCHIDWHFTAGLAATIVERPSDLRKNLQIPQEVLDLCAGATH